MNIQHVCTYIYVITQVTQKSRLGIQLQSTIIYQPKSWGTSSQSWYQWYVTVANIALITCSGSIQLYQHFLPCLVFQQSACLSKVSDLIVCLDSVVYLSMICPCHSDERRSSFVLLLKLGFTLLSTSLTQFTITISSQYSFV